MGKCCSFTASRIWCFKYSFSNSGLKSSTIDLTDGTVMHCWIPKSHKENKPSLLLIHGLGGNAMWQWNEFISRLSSRFNVYVPDLLFFGESYTTRPERSEHFQAQCIMRTMESYGVKKMTVVGLSYGGFVGYSMAVQFPEAVEKLVLGCSGICLHQKDLENGFFQVTTAEEVASIFLPQTPDNLRQLLNLTFYKPANNVPSCFLNDFIDVMYTVYRQERKELIEALHNNRKFSDHPKITQPTLIIWGDYDQIFPVEMAHSLKSHVGDNAQLVIIKNAGHAIQMEKPKEFYKHLKSFLLDSHPSTKPENNGNIHKLDLKSGS